MLSALVCVLALVWAPGSIGTAGVHPEPEGPGCDDLLASWVSGISPTFHGENQTLGVDLTSLYQVLAARGCYTLNQVWLELWRVTDTNPRDESFGSTSYFSKYERCHELDPDLFAFHSTKRLEPQLNETSLLQKINIVEYHHVVEHEYILRACPCSKRRHQQQQPQNDQNVCECKHSTTEKPLCSQLITIEQSPEATVYPWCRSNFEDDGENPATKMIVHSPVVNCTSVLFTGIMASCTPLQSYDRVRLSLHLVDFGDDGYLCNNHKHFGNEAPVIIVTDIHNINGSHGDFSVHLGNLKSESYYCILIELLDHPYCNSHLMIGQSNRPSPLPRVCVSHVGYPVITPKCAEQQGQVVKRVGGSYYLIAILAVGLAAIIGVIVLCLACICARMRRRFPNGGKNGGFQSKTKDLKQSRMPRPVSGFSCHSLESGTFHGYAEATHDCYNLEPQSDFVFLLQLPRNANDDAHVLFRQWIETLGLNVRDLTNPEEDENINPDPEGWVQDLLSHPKVKVVVIDGGGDDLSHGIDGSDLCPRHRQELGLSNVPSSSCTDSTSIAGSSVSSINERPPRSDTGSQFEVDPLLDDPRHDLRVYAWNFIQSHFAGKYNQILFVRFCRDSEQTPGFNHLSVASNLTPLRQSFLIPHHLPEVRMWLRPYKILPKKQTDHYIATSEQRLRSTLKSCSYDCI